MEVHEFQKRMQSFALAAGAVFCLIAFGITWLFQPFINELSAPPSGSPRLMVSLYIGGITLVTVFICAVLWKIAQGSIERVLNEIGNQWQEENRKWRRVAAAN